MQYMTSDSVRSSTTWSTLNGWLFSEDASMAGLQSKLLEERIHASPPSDLLRQALRLVSEATSADWTEGDLYAEIARLLAPRWEPAVSRSTVNGSSGGGTLRLGASRPDVSV